MVKGVQGVGAVGGDTQRATVVPQSEDGQITINFTNGNGNNVTIKVTEGMTLSELAVKYDTTVEDIMAANNTSLKDIMIGQDLIIPRGTASDELIAQRKHNARMKAEQQEVEQKGLTDPVEVAQHYMNKDLKSGRLAWVPEDTALFGLIKTGGYYEYRTEDEGLFGTETYGEIKDRYNLQDGAIRRHNYIPGGGDSDSAGIYDSKLRLYPADMPIPK